MNKELFLLCSKQIHQSVFYTENETIHTDAETGSVNLRVRTSALMVPSEVDISTFLTPLCPNKVTLLFEMYNIGNDFIVKIRTDTLHHGSLLLQWSLYDTQ